MGPTVSTPRTPQAGGDLPVLPPTAGLAKRLGPMARWVLLIVAAVSFIPPGSALDEVVLKNGRKYLGTILISTPEYIVLSIDDGTVKFPRTAITSPPYTGPVWTTEIETSAEAEDPEVVGEQLLPSIKKALAWLGEFPEGKNLRQIPVMVTDSGRWRYLPAVSFWVDDFFQLMFYGDPERPAAIEVSLHHPPKDAWEQKRVLLEFMFGLAPGLAVDDRFEDLNIRGDSFAVGDLWFSVTGPQSPETPGRWSVLLMDDRTLAQSRASFDELEGISETISQALIDPSKPRSWQDGSWTPDEIKWVHDAPTTIRPSDDSNEQDPVDTNLRRTWTGMGGERVFVRSYQRVQGHYTRSQINWLEAVAVVEAE